MVMKKKYNPIKIGSVLMILIMLASFTGCNTSKTAKGGAAGSGIGAVIGGIIGNKSDNTAKGAIIGAMIGGTAGALIGNYMDKQAEELEQDLEGAKIERVGEGIKITFDSGILFDFDSHALRDATKDNLSEMAETLEKYEDTEIRIEGHTDDVGAKSYNKELSMERAMAVSSYLKNKGVSSDRFIIEGFGESQPLAENDTEQGRQQNRRVEIAIYANEELKEAAKDGEIN
jgi:outer membrane protein OmpA-like peptidoglycan-associated protein